VICSRERHDGRPGDFVRANRPIIGFDPVGTAVELDENVVDGIPKGVVA
jgi:hypothetical protein